MCRTLIGMSLFSRAFRNSRVSQFSLLPGDPLLQLLQLRLGSFLPPVLCCSCFLLTLLPHSYHLLLGSLQTSLKSCLNSPQNILKHCDALRPLNSKRQCKHNAKECHQSFRRNGTANQIGKVIWATSSRKLTSAAAVCCSSVRGGGGGRVAEA